MKEPVEILQAKRSHKTASKTKTFNVFSKTTHNPKWERAGKNQNKFRRLCITIMVSFSMHGNVLRRELRPVLQLVLRLA